MNKGKISQIIGPVIDLEFNEGELPAIYNAVIILNIAITFSYRESRVIYSVACVSENPSFIFFFIQVFK